MTDVQDKSTSTRLCLHLRTTSSRPSADCLVAVHPLLATNEQLIGANADNWPQNVHTSLPERNKCSKSQAGTRTKLELVMDVQPRTSSSRSLLELFRMRSIDALSNEMQLLGSTAMLSSSRSGKPGEAACSFIGVAVSRIKLFVSRSTRNLVQPCWSCSMLMHTVSRVAVRTFDRSNTSNSGHEV